MSQKKKELNRVAYLLDVGKVHHLFFSLFIKFNNEFMKT